MANQFRISPDSNSGWRGHFAGSFVDTFHTSTKSEALTLGKQYASNAGSELIWQKKDGKIQGKNSFGNDDYPPKG